MKTNIKNIEFNCLALVHGSNGRCWCFRDEAILATFQKNSHKNCRKRCCDELVTETWKYQPYLGETRSGDCYKKNVQALIKEASAF